MNQIAFVLYCKFVWSLNEVVGDLRIHVRASVRTSVRPSRCCSKTVHYFFLKLCSQLGLVSVIKIFQALFLKNSCFAHFGQKLSKIGHFGPKWPKIEVFRIFSQSIHQILLIFLTKPSLCSGKNDIFKFYGKIQKWPFLAKFGSFLVC